MSDEAFVPVALLRQACDAAGGQRAWATRHGINETQVSAVLRGRRLVNLAIIEALGLVRIVTGAGYAYRRRSR